VSAGLRLSYKGLGDYGGKGRDGGRAPAFAVQREKCVNFEFGLQQTEIMKKYL